METTHYQGKWKRLSSKSSTCKVKELGIGDRSGTPHRVARLSCSKTSSPPGWSRKSPLNWDRPPQAQPLPGGFGSRSSQSFQWPDRVAAIKTACANKSPIISPVKAYLEARQLPIGLLQVLSKNAGGQRADCVFDVHHVNQSDLKTQLLQTSRAYKVSVSLTVSSGWTVPSMSFRMRKITSG